MSPKHLDIEAALRWAFRDELPKAHALDHAMHHGPSQIRPGWAAVESYAALLTRIDANQYGVVPDVASWAEPHPDALAIGEAVEALDGLEISVPADWQPLAELELGAESARLAQRSVDGITASVAGGRRVFGMVASVIVRRHALLGGAPDWGVDTPELRFEGHSNGQARWFVQRLLWSTTVDGREVSRMVEADGMNLRAKRPYGDAYRKFYLDPDPHLSIVARAEFELWHAALHHLTEVLAPILTSLRLTAFTRSPRPWLYPDAAPSVLPAVETMQTSSKRTRATR